MLLQATQVTDVTFRMMDVVYIVMGTITIVSAIFAGRNAVKNMEVMIASEVDKVKTQFKHDEERYIQFGSRIKEVEDSLDSLEGTLFKKLDETRGEIGAVKLMISEMKSEILERLIDKK